MVTGAVPVEVSVTGKVDAVFKVTLPKARVDVLTLRAGTFGALAFNCSVNVLEMPFAVAVRITGCAVVTADTVAVNPALIAFAGTRTVAGTATDVAPLVRFTVKPLLPASALNVTVQVSVPPPIIEALTQDTAVKAADVALFVPALEALAVLVPEALPQPDTTRAAAKRARMADNLTHRSPCWERRMGSLGGFRLSNVLTSVDAPELPKSLDRSGQRLANHHRGGSSEAAVSLY